MSIKIGFAEELNINSSQIIEFYKLHWPRKIALSDNIFHEWQFVNPPLNENANSCVLAVEDNQILCVMGLNRRNFYLSEELLTGAELTTWVANPKTKGSGAGTMIINFIKNKFDVLFGMGITQEALPIYILSGFNYLRYIPRFLYVVNAEKILQISDHMPYASRLLKKSRHHNNEINFKKISWRDMSDDPFIEGNHFSRNLSDLIWRYENHPYFNYLTYKISSKDFGDGYVVLRAEITKEIKILHVIDILGPQEGFESSIKFIENYAEINEFWVVDIFTTFSMLNKYFNMRGWLSAVDSEFINVPHLYQPMEIRSPATTSLIYWSKTSNVSFYDLSGLYLTKQDCDLDRPTLRYIRNLDE